MTSFANTLPRHHPPSHSRQTLRSAHLGPNPWDKLSQPGVIVSVLALVLTVAYQLAQNRAAARGRPLPTFGALLWNTVVYLTPACVLYAVDRWLNPPLFPTLMLQPTPTTHAAKSDALQRILRADRPGGIVASVSQAGRRAYSNTFSLKSDSTRPAGLVNWDNSCFQNSVLQGLSSLEHLPPYLAALTPSLRLANDDASTAVGALRSFVAELTDSATNGKTLSTPGVLRNMNTSHQQDAQEYFSKLLEQVDEDIAKGAKAACKPPGLEADLARDDSVASQHSDDSGYQSLPMLSKAGPEFVAIRNPLQGLMAQRVACTACGYSEGLSMNSFICLTMAMDAGVGNCTLYQLLDKEVQLEGISGVDCVKCTLLAYRQGLERMAQAVPMAAERLQVVDRMLDDDGIDEGTLKKLRIPDSKKVSSTKTKQVAVARPPPSLAIHMNRSVFDPIAFDTYKNLAAVRFPSVLDLGPWCIGSAQGGPRPIPSMPADGQGSQQEEHGEQWILDATASMVAGSRGTSQISGPIYELRAVITHYGRHENGHYVCYRKHPRRTPETVEQSDAEEGAGQSPNSASETPDDKDTLSGDSHQEAQPVDTTPAAAAVGEPYGPDETQESQWWRLSDETVIPVSEEDVLAQGGVFMLFYDCVDPNSILVTPAAANMFEVESSPLARGRNSPSQSEESDATLCNAPSDRESSLSEISLVADSADEVSLRDGVKGDSQGVVDQSAPQEPKTVVRQPQQYTSSVSTSADMMHDSQQQDGNCKVSVIEVVGGEDKPVTEHVMNHDASEYEHMGQAADSMSETSSVTMGSETQEDTLEASSMSTGRSNSVASSDTLAAEEDLDRATVLDKDGKRNNDKMDLNELATQPDKVTNGLI
ncbi:unnamed protein product [Discula destructiva]